MSSMTGTLTFDLEDGEARTEFRRASNAREAWLVMYEFDQYLRGMIKHAGDDVPEAITDEREKIRDVFREMVYDAGLELG